jgi:glycosyltransferase involved in cell wall biosynthesis
MRIAWLGPEPSLEGGVPYAATQILLGLANQDTEVDAYIAAVLAPYGEHFQDHPGLRIFEERVRWDWNRWYSRDPLIATATSLVARVRAQKRLVALLSARHADSSYDLIYQFSQFEVPWLKTRGPRLPPVIVHPEVHAAGELRWHRRERQLALQCGGALRTEATTVLLASRALTQKRDSRAVSAFIAPSRTLASELATDYAVPKANLHVVPNPIDVERYRPPHRQRAVADPVELLFVSRMSVRKGVEMIVALSHRLGRDPGKFRLRIVGTGASFSDYRPLLATLNTDVATYGGSLPSAELAQLYRDSDIVLQPSHYEPFALTVGEALASGTPVVVSDAVGAGEDVPSKSCRIFRSGDLDGFEAQVRDLAAAVQDPVQRGEIRGSARQVAVERFTPDVVCRALTGVFETVISAHRRGR